MMTVPFLTLPLRRKKDVLSARQKARRVANLLCFQPHDQACIAAGTFVVASQALLFFGKASLCFRIENHQLHIFAAEANPVSPLPANRITHLIDEEKPSLYRLIKALPTEQSHDLAENDLGWLVNKIAEIVPANLFEEIDKQNQEILMLLSELRLCRASSTAAEEKSQSPHAA